MQDTVIQSLVCSILENPLHHAYVFWPRYEEWVSASPRPATEEEILAITQHSLQRWF